MYKVVFGTKNNVKNDDYIGNVHFIAFFGQEIFQ